MNKDDLNEPSISGMPEEVQQNIIEDGKKIIRELSVARPKIGISISENEDLEKLGFGSIHLRDLLIEIARNLLINDFAITYGGDLRKEGFTEIFTELAYQYLPLKDAKKLCFTNYFAFPIYLQLTKAHQLSFKKNRAEIITVPPPEDLEIDPSIYIKPNSLEGKYIWARSLSAMRNAMIKDSVGRILVGGKINNYLGIMPGVLEEAKITLEQGKPLYLVGGYGGCANYVAQSFLGKELSFTDDIFHLAEEYLSFKDYYNQRQPQAVIDLKTASAFFQEYGLEKLSTNNGLSPDDNLRLFSTIHHSEIIYLIFKGLNNLK